MYKVFMSRGLVTWAFPSLVLLFIFVVVWSPHLFVKPAYGFMYLSAPNLNEDFIKDFYFIENQKLTTVPDDAYIQKLKDEIARAPEDDYSVWRKEDEVKALENIRFFVFDPSTMDSNEISLNEALQYTFVAHNGSTSPDGYRVSKSAFEHSREIFDFVGPSSSARYDPEKFYISNRKVNRIIYLHPEAVFLGWLEK